MHSSKINTNTRCPPLYLLKREGINKQQMQPVSSALGLLAPWQHPRGHGARAVSPWRSCDTERESERKGRRKKREKKKAREKVKYLPLLSNTSYNSWAVSSRVACCFRGPFISQRWWVMRTLLPHILSLSQYILQPLQLQDTAGLLGPLGEMCVCCCKGHRRYLIRDGQSHMSVSEREPLLRLLFILLNSK